MSTHIITLPLLAEKFPAVLALLTEREPRLSRFASSTSLYWKVEVSPELESPEDSFASGDAEYDRQDVATVKALAEHTVWGWCTLEAFCVLSTDVGVLSSDSDYLGACSYESFESFVESADYVVDMCLTTFTQLADATTEAASQLTK